MTDECESDLVSAILMWLIIVVGIINICAMSLFLVASVVTAPTAKAVGIYGF